MRGRCYVETDDAGNIIRIFRNQGSAMGSPSWDRGLVKEYPRRDAIQSIRNKVFKDSWNKCQNCGNLITFQTMHMHEKIPRGRGGEISVSNSIPLCSACHILRSDSAHGERRVRFGERN